MEVALYLLPVTLGDTAIEKVLPSYNREFLSVEQAYFSRSYIGLSCSACRGTLHGSYF